MSFIDIFRPHIWLVFDFKAVPCQKDLVNGTSNAKFTFLVNHGVIKSDTGGISILTGVYRKLWKGI